MSLNPASIRNLFTGNWKDIADKHRAIRFESFRRIDVFELGTALGQHEAAHKIDFLKILPKGEDKFFKERQK